MIKHELVRARIELTEWDKRSCTTTVSDEQVEHNPYKAVAQLALELYQCGKEKEDVVEKIEQHNKDN